jgi:hypothetical protein
VVAPATPVLLRSKAQYRPNRKMMIKRPIRFLGGNGKPPDTGDPETRDDPSEDD